MVSLGPTDLMPETSGGRLPKKGKMAVAAVQFKPVSLYLHATSQHVQHGEDCDDTAGSAILIFLTFPVDVALFGEE